MNTTPTPTLSHSMTQSSSPSTPKPSSAATSPSSAASGALSIQAVVIGAVSALVLRILLNIFRRPSSSSSTTTDTTSVETAGNTTMSSSTTSAAPSREISRAELATARGGDGQPLYIAMKDPYGDSVNVFDVSSGRSFYGPGSGYHLFTGRDATYGLATSCLDPQKQDGDISTLSQAEKDTHVQWYEKYASKYPIVGTLVADGENDDDGQQHNRTNGAVDPKKDD